MNLPHLLLVQGSNIHLVHNLQKNLQSGVSYRDSRTRVSNIVKTQICQSIDSPVAAQCKKAQFLSDLRLFGNVLL